MLALVHKSVKVSQPINFLATFGGITIDLKTFLGFYKVISNIFGQTLNLHDSFIVLYCMIVRSIARK